MALQDHPKSGVFSRPLQFLSGLPPHNSVYPHGSARNASPVKPITGTDPPDPLAQSEPQQTQQSQMDPENAPSTEENQPNIHHDLSKSCRCLKICLVAIICLLTMIMAAVVVLVIFNGLTSFATQTMIPSATETPTKQGPRPTVKLTETPPSTKTAEDSASLVPVTREATQFADYTLTTSSVPVTATSATYTDTTPAAVARVWPEFYNVSSIRNLTLSHVCTDITETSDGNLVLVAPDRLFIYAKQGYLKYNITIPGTNTLYGVARQGQVLFVSDTGRGSVHVLRETGQYLRNMNPSTGTIIYGIAVANNVIFITTYNHGIYKLSFDANYNILNTELFAKHNYSLGFTWQMAVTLQNSYVVAVSFGSNNIHIFNLSGNRLMTFSEFGSGDGQLRSPMDLVIDPSGMIYVADYENNRIVLFSSAGQFVKTLVTPDDSTTAYGLGALDRTRTLYLYGTTLYVVTGLLSATSHNLYIIELT